MKKSLIPGLFLFFLLTVLSAGAQEESAEIVYADGDGFTLVREGDPYYYDLYAEPAEGVLLGPGDVILTEQNTWLELELTGTGTLIKVAENTTFSIDSLEGGGGVFGVSYGRVRAKVEKLTQDTPFWVQGTDTVAGVRGTDFGFDLFYEQDSPEAAKTEVYCFQGKVEVVRQLPVSKDEEASGEADFTRGKENTVTVVLGRNEMVTVDSGDAAPELNKVRVRPELKEFWDVNDFIYEPVAPEPAAVPGDDVVSERFFQDSRQLKQAALFTSLGGAILTGSGAAMFALAGDDGRSAGIGLMSIGSFTIAAGATFLIQALILDSRNKKVSAPAQ